MKHKILLLELTSQPYENLTHVFTQCGYQVQTCKQINEVSSFLADKTVDFLVINVNLPHPSLLKEINKLLLKRAVPTVMFSKSSDKYLTEEAIQCGINALVVDGFAAYRLKHILDAAKAHFDHTQSLTGEIRKLKIQLADRKTIDKAKDILMKRREIDEAAAIDLIRKMAMDRNQNLAQVATNIIDVDELVI